jgi:hypothetical protein
VGQRGIDARQAIHPKALSVQPVCVHTAAAESSERSPATATVRHSSKNLRMFDNS